LISASSFPDKTKQYWLSQIPKMNDDKLESLQMVLGTSSRDGLKKIDAKEIENQQDIKNQLKTLQQRDTRNIWKKSEATSQTQEAKMINEIEKEISQLEI